METRPFLLHALSPLHAGTGQAVDVIDLPIARLRSTGIPIVPGSSIKGVLRDARRPNAGVPGALSPDEFAAIFGPDTNRASEHAGALMVTEARLFLLPVRSFRGTFAWVTSPLLLTLALRDLLGVASVPAKLPNLTRRQAVATADTVNLLGPKLYIEDLDLSAQTAGDRNDVVNLWAASLANLLWPGTDELSQSCQSMFHRRFVVVDDETMTFLWETSTQIDARVRVNPDTRTVADKALWYEESLPPETVLVGLFAATRSMRDVVKWTAQDVLSHAVPSEQVLQFGGKATVGRGRCRLLPAKEWSGATQDAQE